MKAIMKKCVAVMLSICLMAIMVLPCCATPASAADTLGDGTDGGAATATLMSTGSNAPTDITLSSSSIAENTAIGTAVGTFSTTDADSGDTFTYSFVSGTGDTNNGSFTIDGNSLNLKFTPDYETKSSYSIRVRTTDSGSLTYEKAFTITIIDVNEAPTVTATGQTPAFTQAYSSEVSLFKSAVASTIDDGQTFSGAELTVTNVSDTTEYLTIGGTDVALTNGTSGTFTGGSYSVSVSDKTATVTLSGMALDNTAMGTLINGITYKNSALPVTVGERVITLTSVTDSGSSNNSAAPSIAATVTVAIRPAVAVNSTVIASSTSVLANGTATSTITVTLKDTNGNLVAGKTVTLAQGTGSSTITPVSAATDSSGQAVFTVSSTKAEVVTYTATDTSDSVSMTQTAVVTFTVPTYTVTINTRINGTAANMTSVVLKNGSLSITASNTSTGIYMVTQRENGTYEVYVGGIYTGVDVAVNSADAIADVNYYTVTFDTKDGSAVDAQNVLSGSKAVVPDAPSKAGYTFAGWYTDTECTDGNEWNFNTVISTASTLYAKWVTATVATFKVTYDAGSGTTSGSVPVDSSSYTSGTKVTVKGNMGNLAKAGSVFVGWSDGAKTYSAGETFIIASDVTLTAKWTSVTMTYTVIYSRNCTNEEIDTYTTQTNIVSGSTLTAPAAPTRSGYTFIGWYKDVACVSSWNFSVDTVTYNRTLYAKWSANNRTISGAVQDDATTPIAVSGATVKVIQGNTLFGKTITDSDGGFAITDVPDGIYNLVITKDSREVTACITVTSEKYELGTITLPSGNVSSLEINSSDTPNIVVDNLDDVFNDSSVYTQTDKDSVAGGGTVEVKLTVQKNDSSANRSTVVAAMASEKYISGMVLDVDMTKTVTSSNGAISSETSITALDGLITLVIPLPPELQGEKSYVIARAHDYGGGVVTDIITTTPNAANESISVNSDETEITLYVKYFSTYAIGYISATTSGKGSVNHYIMATAGTGGSISPSGTVIVTRGSSKTFTISPNTGYVISNVIVDDESKGAISSYTFSNVSESHTIKAVFDKKLKLPYYIDESGSEVFIGFAAEIDGEMKYIAPQGVTILFKENPKSFADTYSHWAKDSISFVAERELFLGTAGNQFSPDTGMTRAMFATVIGRLYERSCGEIEASNAHTFIDCNYSDYYGKYVDWAAKEGIIEGYGNGRFGPGDQITREQMATLMYRFANFLGILPSNMDTRLSYPDYRDISSWAVKSALYCQSTGIITGRSGGNFAPKGTATRAEVAVILERFIEGILD